MSNGRYLVSGGAGFIGSHLCERLIEKGNEVIAVDNLLTGRMENLKTLLGRPGFQFIRHDINEPLAVSGGLKGIFHMASPASPIDYARHPIETLHVGSMGSDNMLRLARDKDCPILLASTSEIYGDPLVHPQKETYWGNVNSIGPRSCYDEAKRYMEALAYAYHRAHGVKVRVIRIFNTYGPRMRTEDGRVVPNFLCQVIRGERLTIYGDGKQTRSFCYVDDLVEGAMRVLECDHVLPINLGNPEELTILQFADRILKAAGKTGEFDFRPLPEDDPKTRCPDITKAKTLLGWQPKTPLDQGLQATYAYFKETLA